MSDVLEIARNKREKLKAEIAYLDAFIRMGEKIAKDDEGVVNIRDASADAAVRLSAAS